VALWGKPTRIVVAAEKVQRSSNAPDETRLSIPFGNKQLAMRLGARYRSGGWFAPPGTNLEPFQEKGWL
jgi:DNA topoisomerase-3